jgi:predicted O-methyltransferase YrrM
MNPILEEMYATGQAYNSAGVKVAVHSHIGLEEGALLTRIIRGDTTIRRTLEVGCACGASSLFICEALADREGASHTILDPFQFRDYEGVGAESLKRAGYTFAKMLLEKSEFALPRLAQEEGDAYDLVFIDGCHTFDHALMDIFYANMLLRIGGYIILDDYDFPGVRKAITYLSKYPAYRVIDKASTPDRMYKPSLASAILRWIPRPLWPLREKHRIKIDSAIGPTMMALKKVKRDDRHWTWYKPF